MQTFLLALALLAPNQLPAAEAQVTAAALALSETAAAEAVPTPEPSAFKRSLISGLNLSQAHFDNWRPGGEDSLAWTAQLVGAGAYDRGPDLWENNLKLAYGQSRIGELEARKSADSIRVDSTYTRRLNAYVNPYVSAAWDTQFVEGYRYFSGTTFTPQVVSKFMDPGYFTESAGLGFARGDWFKFKVGAAAKQTVTDAYPAYADDPATPAIERVKSELGASSQADLKLSLGQNLLFSSGLELFSNLAAVDQVDVKWVNLLSAKFNSWLTANLALDIHYDRDVSTQRQLKQGLNLGLSYNLF